MEQLYRREGRAFKPVNGNGSDYAQRYQGIPDAMVQNHMQRAMDQIVANFTSRSSLAHKFFDPRRDINDECGFPETHAITAYDLRTLYERDAVANRVVTLYPSECWKVTPEVYEDEDPQESTEFEEAWEALQETLRGDSWFQDQEGNPIWEYLLRADILSGIGSFGVVLLGIDDGLDLREPAEGVEELGSIGAVPDTEKDKDGKEQQVIKFPSPNENNTRYQLTVNQKERELLYVRCFDEDLVTIQSYEGNITSPRYGQPTMYSLKLNDMTDRVSIGPRQIADTTVHWTRVIHLADNLGGSELFGAPRMRPVLNWIYNLQKIYHANGEAAWRNMQQKLFFSTHPQLGGDVDVDMGAFRTEMEKMMNSLQHWQVLRGMDVNPVAPTMVDPSAHAKTQLESICIQLGVPLRVFMGTERGELASSQDEGNWNGKLQFRRNTYVTPRVIVPFIDRLIMLGVLPEPTGYSVVWPLPDALSDIEKAQVAATKTEALAKYVQGGVEALIAPMDYLTKVLDATDEEAEQILESAKEAEALIDEPEPEEGNLPFGQGEEEIPPEEEQETIELVAQQYNLTNEERQELIANFNPSQPRGADGKWSSGGGGVGGSMAPDTGGQFGGGTGEGEFTKEVTYSGRKQFEYRPPGHSFDNATKAVIEQSSKESTKEWDVTIDRGHTGKTEGGIATKDMEVIGRRLSKRDAKKLAKETLG